MTGFEFGQINKIIIGVADDGLAAAIQGIGDLQEPRQFLVAGVANPLGMPAKFAKAFFA